MKNVIIVDHDNIFFENELYIYSKLIKINFSRKSDFKQKNKNCLLNIVLYFINIIFVFLYFKNTQNFQTINNNNFYIKAKFCSMSDPGIQRVPYVIGDNRFSEPEPTSSIRAEIIERENNNNPLIQNLNNGSNYKNFKLSQLFYGYLMNSQPMSITQILNRFGPDFTVFSILLGGPVDLPNGNPAGNQAGNQAEILINNPIRALINLQNLENFTPPLPLRFDSPIKPFTFYYPLYKKIYKNKLKIYSNSKISFSGCDLLINSEYSPFNLLKFKLGLFGRKSFYTNKLFSNNIKFFLTPSLKICNKNISLKTKYFTAFKTDSNYLESILKYKKNFGTNHLSLKFIYNYRFLGHRNSMFNSKAGRFIQFLFYRNTIQVSKYGFLNQSKNIVFNKDFNIQWYNFITNRAFRHTQVEDDNQINGIINRKRLKVEQLFYDLNCVIGLEKNINSSLNYNLSYCFNSKKLWVTLKYLK
uniref:hypothetical protein n=1 Tax=Ulva meridionalis TaxID=434723 RepID=UPI0028E0A3FD|nr:hypothetical protein NQY40_pgp026 [Ulva meridionalis]WFS80085.1 hypothetical protein [Ulva meridionalis]